VLAHSCYMKVGLGSSECSCRGHTGKQNTDNLLSVFCLESKLLCSRPPPPRLRWDKSGSERRTVSSGIQLHFHTKCCPLHRTIIAGRIPHRLQIQNGHGVMLRVRVMRDSVTSSKRMHGRKRPLIR